MSSSLTRYFSLVTITLLALSCASAPPRRQVSPPLRQQVSSPTSNVFVVETRIGRAVLEDYNISFTRGCYQNPDGTLGFCTLASPEDPSSMLLGKELVCSPRTRILKITHGNGPEYSYEGRLCVGFHDGKSFSTDVLFISNSQVTELGKEFLQSTIDRYGQSAALGLVDRDRALFVRPSK